MNKFSQSWLDPEWLCTWTTGCCVKGTLNWTNCIGGRQYCWVIHVENKADLQLEKDTGSVKHVQLQSESSRHTQARARRDVFSAFTLFPAALYCIVWLSASKYKEQTKQRHSVHLSTKLWIVFLMLYWAYSAEKLWTCIWCFTTSHILNTPTYGFISVCHSQGKASSRCFCCLWYFHNMF